MRFQVRHRTSYRFSREVFLDPHLLRLLPRSDGAQRVGRFQLSVSPQPQGRCDCFDAEGNAASHVWFGGLFDRLEIVTDCDVTTSRENPFDFLLAGSGGELPLHYPRELQPLLVAARQRVAIPIRSDPVRDLAEELARATDRKLTRFLMTLCNRIYDGWKHIRRDEGPPWPPEQTFERQSGSCRDLAWLLVDACRAAGLAARFVSGYQEGEVDQDRRELHAWSEVYIPGAGWRGFDPTHGLAVADRHVVLAASVAPAGAAPVDGSFRGAGVTAALEYDIQMKIEGSCESSTEESNGV